VQSNENPGFASGVVNGETDTLSMQIAVILGGQTFTFNLLSPDLGVSATGSIVASTSANNIVFTSGSSYSTVQQILSDGINYYTIGAIIQWSDNGTSGWGNSQTISYQDIDTYRISMELLALRPVNPNPEPDCWRSTPAAGGRTADLIQDSIARTGPLVGRSSRVWLSCRVQDC
jgi:hypothetical protein